MTKTMPCMKPRLDAPTVTLLRLTDSALPSHEWIGVSAAVDTTFPRSTNDNSTDDTTPGPRTWSPPV